jgi:RNA recognition motif-containing protein
MPSNNPQKRLFVGSLPFRFPSAKLISIFSPFGKIVDWQIVYDKWGKSRGMAYVEFDNLDSAIEAKTKLHRLLVEDRTIIVDYAQPDPLTTPEGQQRHQEAVNRRLSGQAPPSYNPSRPRRESDRPSSPSSSIIRTKDKNVKVIVIPISEEGFSHPKYKSKYAGKKGHMRETIFKQRYFGSSQGKKFAAKTRSKKPKS